MVVTPTTYRLPPVITGSSWITVYQALFEIALKRDRRAVDPVLTNAEVVALVMGWLAASRPARFPLWYQLAAAAYGWTGSESKLDTSPARGARLADPYLLKAYWMATSELVAELRNDPDPRLDLDGRFSDPVFQSQVMTALRADGAPFTLKPDAPITASAHVSRRKKNNFAAFVMMAIVFALVIKPRRLTQ